MQASTVRACTTSQIVVGLGSKRKPRENVMPGPLSGVRVLDLTGVVSGPFATMFLADQGADVLKIEPIGGDITRRSRATIDKAGEFSALFISSNRGKRSLSIDVKSEAGREVLAKLVAQATCWCRISAPAPWSGSASGPTNCASAIRA
jgi:crotonobetainyl-CoA:carnitine CoA-transferase CaiB-like acyl-CoA transferase